MNDTTVAIDEVRVATWAELNEALYEGSWRADLGRHRSSLAFRGLPDAQFDLKTSLMRLGGRFDDTEAHLLRSFERYAFRAIPAARDSIWALMALGQHHGLPTRLLDWTYSPYVALHFATIDADYRDVDGVVLCVDYVAASRLLPSELRSRLDDEAANVFTLPMLAEACPTLEDLEALSDEPFVVFVEPPSLDERIVNQYALFSLMSSASARLDDWLTRHPEAYRRVVVPADLRREVRDKLDQANVTERVLFPGLDGLSSWLRRYYSPRSQPGLADHPDEVACRAPMPPGLRVAR